MASPYETVESSFAQAQVYANQAQAQMATYAAALNTNLYVPPTIDATWASITAPTIPTVGAAPTFDPIVFAGPDAPTALTLTEPTISIDDFTEAAPGISFPAAPTVSYGAIPTVPGVADITLPAAPTVAVHAVPTLLDLAFPAAPAVSYGVAPTVPSIGAVTIPDAPLLTLPDAPSLLTLTTPTFGGVDIHATYLAKLENIPTLALVSPTPYSYARGAEYASELLTGLKAVLNARLSGGTGLPPAVEQALWDRARSRETQIGLANEAEIMRSSEAMGFMLPTGVLAAQLREAQQAYYDKLSGLSRDISIKQAELEQENLKQTIAAGMDLEGKLIDYSYKLEQLTFESAKTYAENAIQTYNAAVEQYKALLSAYQTYATVYRTIMDGELTKVEVYKAELAGEQTKAEINNGKIQQYKALIEAGMAQVEVYKAQVGGATALTQLEQAKVGAAGEQIRAYVAQISAETAKVEAYKATVQAEQAKSDVNTAKVQQYKALIEAGMSQVEIYKAQVGGAGALIQLEQAKIGAAGEQIRAYVAGINAETAKVEAYKAGVQGESAKVEVYKIKADVFSAKVNAQAEKARLQLGHYTALYQAKASEWEGYKARVGAEGERIRALGVQSSVLLDGYKAENASVVAQAEMNARAWESSIKQYEAGQNYALQAAKINGDFSVAASNARLDASKVGAQVYAQLTSSAYSMIHATAGVTAGTTNSVSYQYSNDTEHPAPTKEIAL